MTSTLGSVPRSVGRELARHLLTEAGGKARSTVRLLLIGSELEDVGRTSNGVMIEHYGFGASGGGEDGIDFAKAAGTLKARYRMALLGEEVACEQLGEERPEALVEFLRDAVTDDGVVGIFRIPATRPLVAALHTAGYGSVRETPRWKIVSRSERKRSPTMSPLARVARSAAKDGDWPLLAEIGEQALVDLQGAKQRAVVAAAYVVALRKLQRYVRCIAVFEEERDTLPLGAPLREAGDAVAAYLDSLHRMGASDRVAALVDELPRKLLRLLPVANAAQAGLMRTEPQRSLMLAHQAVAMAITPKVQQLGRYAYALQRHGRPAAEVWAAVREWAYLKVGPGEAFPHIGYLEAALASRRCRPRAALRALNRELDRAGLAPVRLRTPRHGFQLENLEADVAPAADREGPLVTVVMPAYNLAGWIDTAIAAVLAQTHGNLELLVVDDASTDGTGARARAWAARDDRVRVLELDRNRGAYVARNVGLRESRGAFITTHDADDWSHPQRLETQVEAIRAQGGVACITSWVRADVAGQLALRATGKVLHDDLSSLMFTREAFEALGYYDTVRASADSEYRSRLKLTFGDDAFADRTDLCMAFGRLSDASLTGGGPYAYDEFGYNHKRGFYWKCFRDWQLRCLDAGYVPRIEFPSHERVFWVPSDLRCSGDLPEYARAPKTEGA